MTRGLVGVFVRSGKHGDVELARVAAERGGRPPDAIAISICEVAAAMIAQVGPETDACLRAAAAGAWLHGGAGGLAARERGPVGFLASDLAGFIPAALKELHASS